MNNSPRLLQAAFAAVILFFVTPHLQAGGGGATLLGDPFTPAGANFTMFALQGIDASHTFGDPNFSPQVNANFEFDGTNGVSYDTGGGNTTDFGIGLYSGPQNNVVSTGLKVQYNAPVLASSVTITVEDFDIKVGDAFFNNQKVEPTILLLGANNVVYGTATPKDVFANLTPVAGANGKKSGDVWDVKFSGLLNTLHLADAPITGFVLLADTADGEKPNSDPYLLINVGNGNGIPQVPEAGNYVVGLAAIVFAGLFHLGQVRLKRKAIKA